MSAKNTMRFGKADDMSTVTQSIMLLAQEQKKLKQMVQQNITNLNRFQETVLADLQAIKASLNIQNTSHTGRNLSQPNTGTKQKTTRGPPQADDSEDDNVDYLDPNVNRETGDKTQKRGLGNLTGNSRSPVQLNTVPPSDVRKPLPKNEPNSSDYDRLFDIRREPYPSKSLLVSHPQESDFINLMKTLNMDINPSTIQSVCQAVKGPSQNRAIGLHTVLVLDMSDSVKGSPWDTEIQPFISQLLDGLESSAGEYGLKEYLALITCCRAVGVVPYTDDYAQTRNLLGRMTVGGRTPLMTALTLAMCYVELHGECVKSGELLIRPRIIIVSDFEITMDAHPFNGNDKDTSGDRIMAQRQLFGIADKYGEQTSIDVVCVSVGNKNEPVMKEFAKKCKGVVVEAKDKARIRDVAFHYRYKLCVGRALWIYDQKMKRDNVETDVYDHLRKLLPQVGLGQEHKTPVIAMLETALQNDELGAMGDIETDALTTGSFHDQSKPGRSQMQTTLAGPQRQTQTQTEVTVGRVEDHSRKPPKEPPQLPRWTHTKIDDSIGFEEQGGLPSIGSRVCRGKDWQFGDQGGGGPGTVIGHKQKGIAYVLWDTNQIGTYRYNYDGMYDLQKIGTSRTVGPGEIEVGCAVVRGPDWDRGDEDGGPNTVGVVVRKLRNRYVKVRWPSRVIDTYRFGAEDKWELEVTTDDHHSSGRETPEGPESNVSQPATGNQSYSAADGAALRPLWSFKDKSGQWRPFSADSNEKLENKKEVGHQHCVVTYQNESVRCSLDQNLCELGGNKYPLKREMLKDEEISSMIALQDFLPPIN